MLRSPHQFRRPKQKQAQATDTTRCFFHRASPNERITQYASHTCVWSGADHRTLSLFHMYADAVTVFARAYGQNPLYRQAVRILTVYVIVGVL